MKKMLVTSLVVVAAIIGVLLLVALVTKKEYAIEREITINKPKQEVFNYVKYQKNQDNYSKWVMTDPAAKKEYTGTDGTVGFGYAWDSQNKNVGKGEQKIIKIIEGERIELKIHFIKPFEGLAYTHLTTESISDNQTKIKWGMQGRNPFPLNLMNLFIDKILGKDLQISLTNLKTVLEKQ